MTAGRQPAVGLAADALAMLRRHPRHLVLASLVAGLLAAPSAPATIVLLALAAAALGAWPLPADRAADVPAPNGSPLPADRAADVPAPNGSLLLALLAALALVAGALGAQARLTALDGTQLPPLFGTTVTARVVLQEQPRPVRYGHTALASAGGERVMLRIGQHVAWPSAPTGAIVEVRGRLRALGPFEQYYARRGAHAAISLDAAAATGTMRGGPLRFVDGIRTRAERALSAGMPQAQAALLRGMTLGQDEALDARTREEFRVSSLAHVLAASGQNVALLLALALPLLAWAGFGLRGRLLGALALIALYVPLAGAGPSIQRAGVMGAATTVAALAGRPASRWYALLLAAAVTLALNPRASGDPGWQLSFAAVAAIALLAGPTRHALVGRRIPEPVADATAMSFAATVGTAPLLAFHFAQVSLVGLPANLLAAPAIAPITWLGMLAATMGQLSPQLAIPLNALNAYLLAYVGAIAHVAAGVPHASIELGLPGPLSLVASYVGIALATLLARRLRSPGRELVLRRVFHRQAGQARRRGRTGPPRGRNGPADV